MKGCTLLSQLPGCLIYSTDQGLAEHAQACLKGLLGFTGELCWLLSDPPAEACSMVLAHGAGLASEQAVLTAEWLSWVDLGRRCGRMAWPQSLLMQDKIWVGRAPAAGSRRPSHATFSWAACFEQQGAVHSAASPGVSLPLHSMPPAGLTADPPAGAAAPVVQREHIRALGVDTTCQAGDAVELLTEGTLMERIAVPSLQ